MARKERRLQPDLAGAHEYPNYALFAQAHRHRLEQRPGYQFWDGKLQALIEREGNGRGVPLDNPRIWDAFYTRIGGPIRDMFWTAWEDAFGLKDAYLRAVAADERARMANSAPLEVYYGGHPFGDVGDFDTWDQVTEKLAPYLDGSESGKLWGMLLPDDQTGHSQMGLPPAT